MLIKRMVLTHLMETCPNLNTVLQSFVDNSHYEMHFGVKANGDKVVGNLEEDDDGDRKSGHLLSFPITACNICVFVFVLFCFSKISCIPPGIPVEIWFPQPELIIVTAARTGPRRAGPGRAWSGRPGPARPGPARPSRGWPGSERPCPGRLN